MAKAGTSPWDLTALFNAADPKAEIAERHLWVIRLVEWLRRAPVVAPTPTALAAPRRGIDTLEAAPRAPAAPEEATAMPVLRLRHLLGVLERNPEQQGRAAEMLGLFLREVDSAALLADFGFAPRTGLWAEFGRRLRARVLPLTPATSDLGELFALLFPRGEDVAWLNAIDDDTLARLARVLEAGDIGAGRDWRHPFFEAITFLASAIRAAGFSPQLRRRMSAELLVDTPFHQLARVAERLREHGTSNAAGDRALFIQDAQYLRALLDICRRCATSVHEHLEAHGVSVDVVFEVDQLRERAHRIDLLLGCVLAPDASREIVGLVAELAHTAEERRSIRGLFAQHYSLLARKVAERSAATGEHYITRDRAEYAAMLRAAAGGGAVLGGTTLLKFALGAVALGAFWGGLAAGLAYAASFVLIQILHFTVATKQPAMTAPAMAEKLADVSSDAAVEGFVDEVAHLIRSQAAGIFGNVLAVVPVVLAAQWLARATQGAPLVGVDDAHHVLESLTLLGPTALFAALTGVLLFVSSLIAGWVENWFVWHRLDSAIAWNPRIVARLGAARARRWSVYWRQHISGFASNTSLGLMLGLVPPVAAFFGLPLEVRHITLTSGQLAAAVGALGLGVVATAPFWWCVGGIAATGALNLAVSFYLAFRVALRSRGIRLADESRIQRAIRRRLVHAPLSFLLPPPQPPARDA
ncbi:MAG: site-specific recombinase [Caldimonas sp.]